jgi:hypothetical protein
MEYSYTSGPISYSCWLKRNPYDFFMLTNELNSSGEYQQSLGFFPTNLKYYGLYDERRPSGEFVIKGFQSVVLTIKQFRVNQDVYEYYYKVNEQLQAKNRIFDPVARNFTGNIKCLNYPERPVFGVFEVASVNSVSIFFHQPRDKIVKIKRINTLNMENISYSNCYQNSRPDFWFK